MVLEGLETMLRHYRDQVVIAGKARDGSELLSQLDQCRPDVVLMDVRLRGESGLDLAPEVIKRAPHCKIVFLTVYDDEPYLFQALRLGASGFLLKHTSGADLVSQLKRVMSGEIVVDPAMAGRVALTAARLQAGELWPGAHLGLTQRESEVLALMTFGLSNRAIAGRLVIGEETIKSHVGSIYRKLGAKDRAHAVAIALREGVVR
ncbi:MAG: response regulator transcription factor [Actinobacteria bacterium]|nr:response regulator transcription factor [Actinomycetota bacterium]